MPLLVGAVVGVLVRAIYGAFRVARLAIADGSRRVRGRYRTGYAIVPPDHPPGSQIAEPLLVASDPVYLDPLAEGTVTRVSGVRGAAASIAAEGTRWTATGARVDEHVPYWVLFGPNGKLALEAIGFALDLPAAAIERSVTVPDDGALEMVVVGDRWRVAVANGLLDVAGNLFTDRLRTRVIAELGGAPDDEVLAKQMERRWLSGWRAAATAAGHAAIATALAHELPAHQLEALSRAWLELVGLRTPDTVRPVTHAQKVRAAAALPLLFVDRHPTVAAVGTAIVLIGAMAVAPVAALLLFGVLLIAAAVGAAARSVRRDRRVTRRTWAPRGDPDGEQVGSERLQRAVGGFVNTNGHPITAQVLHSLLPRSTMWLAMDGPPPADVARRLDWASRSGDELPVAIARYAEQRVVVAYTDERHLDGRGGPPPAWTVPLAFPTIIAAAHRVGATKVLVDPNSRHAVELRVEGFIGQAEPETSQGSEPRPLKW